MVAAVALFVVVVGVDVVDVVVVVVGAGLVAEATVVDLAQSIHPRVEGTHSGQDH